MFMRFFTNIPEPRNGFKALFEIPKCRHEYKSLSGVITSNNYPSPGGYKPFMVCEYFFNYFQNNRVNLTFTDLDLPFKADALNESDYLTVSNIYFNNENGTEDEIIRITGNTSLNNLPTLISSSGQVIVRFYTFKPSLDRKYRGFKFYFRRTIGTCWRDVVDSSGELSVTNMPYMCNWRITVPKGKRVKVVVDEIRIATPNASIEIKFYNDSEARNFISHVGSSADGWAPISSSDNIMLIRLRQISPDHMSRTTVKYVKIHWTSEEESLCPKTSTDEIEGSFSFQNITDDFKCITHFDFDANETVALKVDEFTFVRKSGIGPSQFYPDVKVIFGAFNLAKNVSSPTVYPANANKFGSNFIIEQRRSSAYKIVSFKGSYKRHPCGGIFKNLNRMTLVLGTIKDSDGAPDRKYGEIDCFWSASFYENNLTITTNVQMTTNCNDEYLKFYNGGSIASPFLMTVCGENSTVGPWTLTDSKYISIHYHAKEYKPEKKVEIMFEKLFKCGGTHRLSLTNYRVYSIRLEKEYYKNNMECVWDISTDTNFNLEVKFQNRFFIGTY